MWRGGSVVEELPTASGDYIELLERFDRKERGWLIRQCTGGRSLLSERFCSAVGQTFRVEPPKRDAWWTIDYHLNWLAAVSHIGNGDEVEIYTGGIVKNNSEDIDLVIATSDRLFLIEAKAVGSWGNGQLQSKLQRLRELCPEGRLTIRKLGQVVDVSFGLTSIRPPMKLDYKDWPSCWLNGSEAYWMEPVEQICSDQLIVKHVSGDGKRRGWKVEAKNERARPLPHRPSS